MSRGIIIGAVIVGCDQRLTDGAYCPKLYILHGVIDTTGRIHGDRLDEMIQRAGWAEVVDRSEEHLGAVTVRNFCPDHQGGKP